jgi:UDP-N-acetylglucosamine diphosphorylase / glucose-1-phosphate thymidylyltransferase / UDP-N-acetylgalactosamine diphosphorylase / glucosamine-1-phosphate N-acetyltransferase / galactosamine-1-phosphate N-acetyltransferase
MSEQSERKVARRVMAADITLVLLCGGVGRRMKPIVTDKALLEFCGKPLIRHQLESARRAGLERFVLVVNRTNLAELKAALDGPYGKGVEYVLQPKPAGMADALRRALPRLGEWPFILASSNDIFEDSVYTALIDSYRKGNSAAYITGYQVSGYFPGGYLVLGKNEMVRRLLEKPGEGKEPSDVVNIVAHLHTSPGMLLDYIKNTVSEEDDVYEKALGRMIEDGQAIQAVMYNGRWQAIKYPWHILEAMDYFLERLTPRIASSARISERAVIDGAVVIEEDVQVFEGSVIRGPSYIGKGSIIGNNVLLRDSIVGEGCIIGYGSEIKHSYIDSGCTFHRNYIGDSIVERECTFGAGAVTANLRLDQAKVAVKSGDEQMETGHDKLGAIVGRCTRTGINASLMPGVRIGAYSFVGPHVCLTADLESGKMAIPEPNYRVALYSEVQANRKRDGTKKGRAR